MQWLNPKDRLSHGMHTAQDLAAGYMSGKLLLKLDAVAFILGHHTAEHFAFLADPANSRARTAFYATLARLLFMEDTPLRFKAFVAPLQQVRSTQHHKACDMALVVKHVMSHFVFTWYTPRLCIESRKLHVRSGLPECAATAWMLGTQATRARGRAECVRCRRSYG